MKRLYSSLALGIASLTLAIPMIANANPTGCVNLEKAFSTYSKSKTYIPIPGTDLYLERDVGPADFNKKGILLTKNIADAVSNFAPAQIKEINVDTNKFIDGQELLVQLLQQEIDKGNTNASMSYFFLTRENKIVYIPNSPRN